LRKPAFEEIAEYRKAFASNNVFWINDSDKKYYFSDAYVYTLEPAEESSEWYNAIMENPCSYQVKVNFDAGLNKTMLWIDAPIFDDERTGSPPLDIFGRLSVLGRRPRFLKVLWPIPKAALTKHYN
jgi:methyl-accepting chemotaxis protein